MFGNTLYGLTLTLNGTRMADNSTYWQGYMSGYLSNNFASLPGNNLQSISELQILTNCFRPRLCSYHIFKQLQSHVQRYGIQLNRPYRVCQSNRNPLYLVLTHGCSCWTPVSPSGAIKYYPLGQICKSSSSASVYTNIPTNSVPMIANMTGLSVLPINFTLLNGTGSFWRPLCPAGYP